MGRRGGEPTAVGCSSIALLQERFRRLEKMREKREDRELLRLFSGSGSGPDQIMQTKCFEPARSSSQPEEFFPPTPALQDSLSLGLNLYSRHAEYQSMKSTPVANFWSIDATTVSTSRAHEKPEVDTSLHL